MNTSSISTINHSEIEVIGTNLANELGHHIVDILVNMKIAGLKWMFIPLKMLFIGMVHTNGLYYCNIPMVYL